MPLLQALCCQTNFRVSDTELAVNVNMEVNVDISFGLESQVIELIEAIKFGVNQLKELAMKITNVNSCVWCGVAFLRGYGGTFQPLREMRLYQKYLLVNRNVEGFESPPSHHIFNAIVAGTAYAKLRQPQSKTLV